MKQPEVAGRNQSEVARGTNLRLNQPEVARVVPYPTLPYPTLNQSEVVEGNQYEGEHT